jgi:hypothetical protein
MAVTDPLVDLAVVLAATVVLVEVPAAEDLLAVVEDLAAAPADADSSSNKSSKEKFAFLQKNYYFCC